ncbi:MAG: prepilin peptidase [Deltaproteobacteria bacterium]|nr:prepilin peptidase [Deltaproteobacteria bacterium]
MAIPILYKFFVFAFGAAVGSFLNVCIYRLPNSRSLIRPRSMCPQCGAPIPFYDNIPLVSYMVLRARCRNCSAVIPLRYPVVEAASGLFAVAIVMRYGLRWEALVLYAFVAALLVVTFIDIDHQIIPNIITYPGVVVGLAASFFSEFITVKDAVLGIAVGAGILLVVALGYYLVTKNEGMGGGDVKLLAMIGAFLGWKAVIFTIFLGSAVGTLAGLAVALKSRKGRKTAVAFGPFLSLGALLYIFYGPELISWYVHLLGR